MARSSKNKWPAGKPENETQLKRQASEYIKHASCVGTRMSVSLPDGTPIIDQPQNLLERIMDHMRSACGMPQPGLPGTSVLAH